MRSLVISMHIIDFWVKSPVKDELEPHEDVKWKVCDPNLPALPMFASQDPIGPAIKATKLYQMTFTMTLQYIMFSDMDLVYCLQNFSSLNPVFLSKNSRFFCSSHLSCR